MIDKVCNVFFLCTGHSARSILAEVLIDHWGKGRFKGYSAGSFPKGEVNPLALALRLRDLERGSIERKVVEIGRVRDDMAADKAS